MAYNIYSLSDALKYYYLTRNQPVSLWLNKVDMEVKQMNDPVNHPSHYTKGKIECIDFIVDKQLNFCRGNAVKYIVRAGLKDTSKEIEDLEKAVFYINYEIKRLKEEKNEKTE